MVEQALLSQSDTVGLMFLLKPILAFRPVKSDWIFAVKTFMAGMLALWAAFMLELPYPIWAIGTVFVVANPFTGMAISKSVFRLLGTLLGAVVALLVTPALIDYPLLFTLFLAVWVGGCLYISMLDRTPRSYVLMLAGYTTVIIAYNCIYSFDSVSVFDMSVGRFLEISVGVVCSGLVSATILPQSIGPLLNQRIYKTLSDSQASLSAILKREMPAQHYTLQLGQISRDIADLHVMAVHLSYEKSVLSGMTLPLQEMMHQLAMFISNLVAMSERLQQLGPSLSTELQVQLQQIEQQVAAYLAQPAELPQADVFQLPAHIQLRFQQLIAELMPEQRIIALSLKMDVRHALQNIRNVQLIWQRVQQGHADIPAHIPRGSGHYPHLHRDQGVAIRGGISAFLVVIISTAFWILTGWSAAFMLAEMAVITACILTAMDNPVPALRMFIRASIYAGVIILVYAFGIFPMVTEFWQLVVVMAPFIIFCLLLFPHPPLTGLALPLLMGTIMGLNFQNAYQLDPVFFFDATLGTVIGPIISVFIIYMVRAISPDMAVQRILALHDQLLRKALFIPYGDQFQVYLRQLLDQIGVLNAKIVASPDLKNKIQLALIEVSTAVDLSRLHELIQQGEQQVMLEADPQQYILNMVGQLQRLRQQIDQYLAQRQQDQSQVTRECLLQQLTALQARLQLPQCTVQSEWLQRIAITLNNIQHSLCHAQHFSTHAVSQ